MRLIFANQRFILTLTLTSNDFWEGYGDQEEEVSLLLLPWHFHVGQIDYHSLGWGPASHSLDMLSVDTEERQKRGFYSKHREDFSINSFLILVLTNSWATTALLHQLSQEFLAYWSFYVLVVCKLRRQEPVCNIDGSKDYSWSQASRCCSRSCTKS